MRDRLKFQIVGLPVLAGFLMGLAGCDSGSYPGTPVATPVVEDTPTKGHKKPDPDPGPPPVP